MVFRYQNDLNHKTVRFRAIPAEFGPAAIPCPAMSARDPGPDEAATLGEDGCWQLDLRGLAPPQPMVRILRHIEQHGGDGRALVVRMDRDPVMLYPELAERGWEAAIIDGDPGEVRLRLQASS